MSNQAASESVGHKADSKYDPITVDVIQNALDAIADEMFATMRKTAMNSIIYEVLDFGVAISDHEGKLASSGAGIPAFIGMLDHGIQSVVNKFGRDGNIFPGDIFVANIPHKGGVSHLNDVVFMLPVFSEETLVAWVANKAHWADIGGMVPSSISPNASEVFQEGLQLPEIKIFERGKIVDGVMDIIMANVRMPETARGDLWAAIASMRAGEKRILELCDKYGDEVVIHSIAELLRYGESVSRAALKGIPHGTFEAEDFLDDGRKLTAKITISDDEFVIDLRGNPPEDKGPFNQSYAATKVDAQVLFKAVTSPDTPANDGSFRALRLICDDHSIFNAAYPSAMGLYYEVGIRALDIMWKALAPHLPERLTAGHYASICGTIIGGTHPDTGNFHTFIEPELGGWGAAIDDDGDNAQYTASHGETFNCAVEINESRNGVIIDQYALNTDGGGEGKTRGGKGIQLDYRIRSDDYWVTAMYSRHKYGPWGLNGGRDGSSNYIKIIRENGKEEVYDSISMLPLKRNDVVRIVTATGGGYGRPEERERDRVEEDIKNEYITVEQAKSVYGYGAS